MTQAFLALLPVFIVIMVGFGLRRSELIGANEWSAVDHVCYYLLFPVIIFKEIAAADFSHVPVAGMALSMALAVLAMFALLVAARKPLQRVLAIDGPQFTSLLQGAARWHTFIAFAIIPVYFGIESLALGAVAAATMTPLLNILCVWAISVYASGREPEFGGIVKSIASNPFVLSSLAGGLWQVLGLPLPAMAVQVLDMIGRGALGLALLTVGAGLRLDEALSAGAPVITGTALKLLLMPAFMAFFLTLFGIAGTPFAVALICGAVPTGSGAYVLARKMGGDASLVASILTLQVLCAIVTIPLVLALFGALPPS